MESITGNLPGRFSLDGMRTLSGKDLAEEAAMMPVEEFDAGHGVTVVRQGMMIKIIGGENLSPHASMAAMRAAKMGGDAGRVMFDTYYKNNHSEFDGSKTFDAILKMANAPRSEPPAPDKPVRIGNTQGDGIFMRGGNNANLKGTPAGDFLEALHNSKLYGGDGDDTLTGGSGSKLYGGEGNDKLIGVDRVILNGEAGDDILTTYGNSTLNGGSGNDRLSAYGDSRFDGGEGDDSIRGYDNSSVNDAQGDNYVSAYRDSTITTGTGNDWISAYSGAAVRAGDGNNMITTYGDSSVISGNGADMIEVGINSLVIGGGGDDLISAGSGSVVNAGVGDDRVTLKGVSTYFFARGDGNDTVSGGAWGQAYRSTDNLSSSVIAYGPGITLNELSFASQGNDLVVSIGEGDSLRIRDYQRHGIPSMTFDDGTTLGSLDITNIVGPGEPYRPASQLMQGWHDANAAYQKANAGKITGA